MLPKSSEQQRNYAKRTKIAKIHYLIKWKVTERFEYKKVPMRQEKKDASGDEKLLGLRVKAKILVTNGILFPVNRYRNFLIPNIPRGNFICFHQFTKLIIILFTIQTLLTLMLHCDGWWALENVEWHATSYEQISQEQSLSFEQFWSSTSGNVLACRLGYTTNDVWSSFG